MSYFKQMIRVYIDLMRSKLSKKLKLGMHPSKIEAWQRKLEAIVS